MSVIGAGLCLHGFPTCRRSYSYAQKFIQIFLSGCADLRGPELLYIAAIYPYNCCFLIKVFWCRCVWGWPPFGITLFCSYDLITRRKTVFICFQGLNFFLTCLTERRRFGHRRGRVRFDIISADLSWEYTRVCLWFRVLRPVIFLKFRCIHFIVTQFAVKAIRRCFTGNMFLAAFCKICADADILKLR